MILHRIEIENFRQLTGNLDIRLARSEERSVTVLLGENGAGKTTLLHAFLWCLYGKKDFDNPGELVSHKAVEDAEMDEDVRARVALTFDADGTIYFVERRSAVRKLEGGQQRDVELEKPFIVRSGADGALKEVPEPQESIVKILPEALAYFFFFRGEDLEDLVAQQGADKLISAVRQFVHLKDMENAVDHLRDVEKELEKVVRKDASGEVKDLSDKIALLGEEIAEMEKKRKACLSDGAKIKQQQEKIEGKLAEIEEVRPFVEKKRALKERLDGIEARKSDNDRDLREQVSADGYLHFRIDVLPHVSQMTDSARERGDLPANIKPQFVNDLLEDGECICGRQIDDDARSVLESWRKKSRLGDLESAISVLDGQVNSLETRRAGFAAAFEEVLDRRAELDDAYRRTLGELNEIKNLLEGKDFDDNTVAGLQQSLAALREKELSIRLEQGRLEDRIAEVDEELEQLNLQRKEKGDKQREMKVTLRRIDAIQQVRGALEKLCRGWIYIVQQYLDAELKSKWDAMAQLERLVEFDSDFCLKIKERVQDGAWRASASSSANKRALALAFVAALIQLARDASEADGKTLNWFPGGKYPLVMDAPFATMDTHFKKSVPAGLRDVIPQLVLISNFDQWSGEVEGVLGRHLGKAYILRLHGAKNARTIPFRGNVYDYVVPEKTSAFDWTEIEEIPL